MFCATSAFNIISTFHVQRAIFECPNIFLLMLSSAISLTAADSCGVANPFKFQLVTETFSNIAYKLYANEWQL